VKARKLIADSSYDPDQLKVIGQAFDDAWEQIKDAVSGRDSAVEASRLKLANAVLAVASTGPMERERIKTDALRMMFSEPTELR